MAEKTVREAIVARLREEGYDGLYQMGDVAVTGCCCTLEKIGRHCQGHNVLRCLPGTIILCTCNFCRIKLPDMFHIGPKPEEVDK